MGSRDHDRSPVRGGNDMTSDPGTVYARIFVGSLTPEITREVLEDHFSRWGNVIGVTLTKNKFGFIQFEKENEAQACLASGYATMLNGVKLTVRAAKMIGQMSAPAPAPGFGGVSVPARPSSGNGWGESSRGVGYGSTRDSRLPASEDSYYDSYYRSSNKVIEGDSSSRYEDYYRDYYDRLGGGGGSSSSYYRTETEPYSSSRSYNSSATSYSIPPEPLDPLDPMRPNDVEIIVPNKMKRAYAEEIEAQLKRMSLMVDLLFPSPDITPTQVISDLKSRHCLYAIFTTAENEKHNSLTLNILHGEPQEHRNMPVDDAMRLIERNFEEYVRQSRLRNARQVVPRDVRNLLLDLVEMRPLSMGDLDKLIKYLRERQSALVDDQIEQKRETAGTQTSMVTGGMAVTYPGYNYLATTMPGAVAASNPTSHVAATPQGLMTAPAPPPLPQPASVSMVSSPNTNAAVAAAAIAAYPATAYGSLSTTGMIGGYGVTPHVASPSQPAPQQMVAAAPASVAPVSGVPPPPQKQSELQERILNLMKNQHPTGGLTTIPSGVPPPTSVPPPRLMSTQTMWLPPQQHPQPNDATDKAIQGSQAAYNPWTQ